MPYQGVSPTDFNSIIQDICAQDGFLSQVVAEKLYRRIEAAEMFDIQTPIKNGSLIPRITWGANYNSVPYVDLQSGDDACAIPSCDFSPEYSRKIWEVVEAECRFELCAKTLTGDFLAAFNKYRRIRPDDNEYDFVIEDVTDKLADVIINSLLAKAWLSDKALTTVDTLKGTDGVLAQITALADGDHCVAVPQNAIITDGEVLYNFIMQAITKYYNLDEDNDLEAPVVFLDQNDARTIVNWLNALGAKSPYNCECVDPDGVVRAGRFTVEGLSIGGLRVKTVPWRKMQKAFPAYSTVLNPTGVLYPNLILVTPVDNLKIGAPDSNELHALKYFYSDEFRKHKWDLGYQFGVAVASDYFVHSFCQGS